MTGCKLEFEQTVNQFKEPNEIKFSVEETDYVDAEIEKLLLKKVIKKSPEQEGQYVSNIFLRPKKDGSFKMILNLKPLNNLMPYQHFKMDSIQPCIYLLAPGCFMASLDLKDAYYSVPISEDH